MTDFKNCDEASKKLTAWEKTIPWEQASVELENVLQTQAKAVDSRLAEAAEKGIGAGVGFERTRRITGYLVGSLERFNNAKRAEEKDRVKHGK